MHNLYSLACLHTNGDTKLYGLYGFSFDVLLQPNLFTLSCSI